jgi:hypothetical protein
LAKFAGSRREGATECGAHLAQIGVVRGCLGVGDLAVDFPGDDVGVGQVRGALILTDDETERRYLRTRLNELAG